MKSQFVIGLPGSGKTSLLHEKIRQDCAANPTGPPILVLVPEQISYTTEKNLLSSGMSGTTRIRVLSFKRLIYWIFSQSPAKSLPPLNDLHRRTLVASALSELRRSSTDGLTRTAGIERSITALLHELAEFHVDAETIAEWAEQAQDKSRILSEKLRELSIVATRVQEKTENRFETPEQSSDRLSAALKRVAKLNQATIYLDHFFGFDVSEQKLMLKLFGQCESATFSFTINRARFDALQRGGKPDPFSVYYPVEETLEWLFGALGEAQSEILEPIECTLENEKRFQSKDLVYLTKNFSQRRPQPTPSPSQAVRFLEAQTRDQECRAAIEQLLKWAEENQWSWSQMAIITRDLETRASTLKHYLARYDVPYFLDRLEPLQRHPLVQGLEALLEITLRDWSEDAIMAFAKSGMITFDSSDLAQLERYIEQRPRTQQEWQAKTKWEESLSIDLFEEPDTKPSAAEEIDRIRREIYQPLSQFISSTNTKRKADGSYSPQDFLRELCHFISENYHPSSDDDHAILKQLGISFQSILEACADEEFAPLVIFDLLQDAVRQLQLPRIPPRLNQVLIGQADRSRFPELKAVVVMGLNETEFPQASSGGSLLTDEEREWIESSASRSNKLQPSGKRRFFREKYIAHQALTRASTELVLTRATTIDEGVNATPSPYWRECLALLGKSADDVESYQTNHLGQLRLPAEAIAYAAINYWESRKPFAVPKPLPNTRLRDFVANASSETGLTEKFILDRNASKVTPDQLRPFFEKGFKTSATSLNAFGDCAFKHYIKSFIKPSSLQDFSLSYMNLGNYGHAVIHEVITHILQDRDCLINDTKFEELLERMDFVVQERLRQNGLLSTLKSQETIRQFSPEIKNTLRALRSVLVELKFQPVETEKTFGRNAENPGIEFSVRSTSGDMIPCSIRGQIDFIAESNDSPKQYFVADFKLSATPKLDWQKLLLGRDLQLAIYELALLKLEPFKTDSASESITAALFPLQPAKEQKREIRGFRSTQFTPESEWIKNSCDELDSISAKAFQSKVQEIITNQLQLIINGEVSIAPSKIAKQTACTYCDFQRACRLDHSMNSGRNHTKQNKKEALELLQDS